MYGKVDRFFECLLVEILNILCDFTLTAMSQMEAVFVIFTLLDICHQKRRKILSFVEW